MYVYMVIHLCIGMFENENHFVYFVYCTLCRHQGVESTIY